MIPFLHGAIAAAAAIAGFVFLRYFRHTRDRFFLFLTASFWLETAGRIWSVAFVEADDDASIYVLRAVSYLLILAAILDKNLPRRRRP